MSEVKVNKITPTTNCGTVTLGDSGDTFSIPSGVTLDLQGSSSGFTDITWDTTAKTSAFTAVAGNGYFVDTTSAAITVTLPASPSAGDFVGIKDYANTADTNNITIARNGSNIQGTANDFVISTEGLSIVLIYIDATQGWVSTGASKASDIDSQLFVTATGGTETTCGDYKIHTFTGPGTFCVSCAGNSFGSNTVDYLVVAGGGGGGGYGGAGAGGYRESSGAASGCYTASPLGACVAALPVSATGYPITIGGGGTGSPGCGVNGSNSVFSTITSAGGGFGSNFNQTAGSGGSGGGTGDAPRGGVIGSGNTPPVSPPQGNDGGQGNSDQTVWTLGGGGGGATATGVAATPSRVAGPGGAGATSSINATPTARASGGGGGGGGPGTTGSSPVAGGGGWFVIGSPSPVNCGTANTGGGGGSTGTGGSGIVIIRYKFQ